MQVALCVAACDAELRRWLAQEAPPPPKLHTKLLTGLRKCSQLLNGRGSEKPGGEATHGCVSLPLLDAFSALPPGLQRQLPAFWTGCQEAVVALALEGRATPGGLPALLLAAFGDVPAVLADPAQLGAALSLPAWAFLELLSRDELRVTSENDVLVRLERGGRRLGHVGPKLLLHEPRQAT